MGDPREMYVDQFCSLIWYLQSKDKKPEEIEHAKVQLWIPPKGVPIDERSPWHPDNQLSNLRRVKNASS